MTRIGFLILLAFVVGCASTPHHKITMDESNLTTLLSTARLTVYPSTRPYQGYVVTNLELGSAWETFGFEEADVILNVDGRSVLEPGANLDLLRAVLKPGPPVEVLRKGEYVLLPVTKPTRKN